MNMVRRSYAVVYRPSSVAFDAPLFIHGELVAARAAYRRRRPRLLAI